MSNYYWPNMGPARVAMAMMMTTILKGGHILKKVIRLGTGAMELD